MATCKTRGCDNEYIQYSTLQNKCVPCMIAKGRKLERKAERKEHKEAKVAIKTKSKWLDETEIAFRRLIRARDRLYFLKLGRLPECVSCGTTKTDIQYAAGHLKTKGGFPELRLDEDNCFLQCNRRCNKELSGNINGTKDTRGYLVGLAEIYGEARATEIIDYVNSPIPPKKWSIPDLETMKKDFNRRANLLERELENFNQ